MAPKQPDPIELDGRTGEGGGQLVRIAVALSAVTSTPIRITNVRGNRPGQRGGGLKAQHVAAIAFLADATSAEVTGLSVGSRTLEFRPRLGPADLKERKIRIDAGSPAASALLVFQAVFPFLLFAGGASDGNDMMELEIVGGTNVSFSLSYEYLDQVLLPALEQHFGVAVERRLVNGKRGWSAGPVSGPGTIWFRFRQLRFGEKLEPRMVDGGDAAGERDAVGAVTAIDATVLAPGDMHPSLERALTADLDTLFPGADVHFVAAEESGHETRTYVLLVARTSTGQNGRRWGRDILHAEKRKGKSAEALSKLISRRVCKELFGEVEIGGSVDEFLQDQLVVFQALAEGRTEFSRDEKPEGDEEDVAAGVRELGMEEERLRKDRMGEPFGEGSMHTTTARWVAAELLPRVQWYNRGRVCDGIGMVMKPAGG